MAWASTARPQAAPRRWRSRVGDLVLPTLAPRRAQVGRLRLAPSARHPPQVQGATSQPNGSRASEHWPQMQLLAAIDRNRQSGHSDDTVEGLARPTRRTRRSRATNCRLSRLATAGLRMSSCASTRTSVETPRTVEVTGATKTASSRRPIGSRVITTTGRILSNSADHTSPRRGAGVTPRCPLRRALPSQCRRPGRSCHRAAPVQARLLKVAHPGRRQRPPGAAQHG